MTDLSSKINSFGVGANSPSGDANPEEGLNSSSFTRKEVIIGMSWDKFTEVDSTVEAFVPTEIKDTNDLYLGKLKIIAEEQGSPIVSLEKLGWEFTVSSDKMETFNFDGITYYCDKQGVSRFSMTPFEQDLVSGKICSIKLYEDGVFFLTPSQSSKIMARFAKFNPVIKETTETSFDIVIGELK